MSAAQSASNAVRHTAAPRTASTTASQRPTRAQQPHGLSFAPSETQEEIKFNLGDIPRVQETLDVEGFKPTLLSRLFDLFSSK